MAVGPECFAPLGIHPESLKPDGALVAFGSQTVNSVSGPPFVKLGPIGEVPRSTSCPCIRWPLDLVPAAGRTGKRRDGKEISPSHHTWRHRGLRLRRRWQTRSVFS